MTEREEILQIGRRRVADTRLFLHGAIYPLIARGGDLTLAKLERVFARHKRFEPQADIPPHLPFYVALKEHNLLAAAKLAEPVAQWLEKNGGMKGDDPKLIETEVKTIRALGEAARRKIA